MKAFADLTIYDCGLCTEPIEDGLGTGEVFRLGGVPSGLAHQECMLRSVMGGIGHQEDHEYWCKGEGNDTDGGRTYRQSALEVFALYQKFGAEGMAP